MQSISGTVMHTMRNSSVSDRTAAFPTAEGHPSGASSTGGMPETGVSPCPETYQRFQSRTPRMTMNPPENCTAK